MSTTDELRRLLDERGVKYSDFTSATKNGKAIFKTRWKHDGGWAELSEWESTGSNNLFIQNVDPEQAIAITLGSEPPYDELLRCLENDWNISASWDGLRKFWNIELTEEGVRLRDGEPNSRAAHGTLTAEQVREAIFNGSSYASYDGAKYYADGISMQAIADELNSRAERTCRNIAEPDEMSDRLFTCSECGARGPYGEGTYHIGGSQEVDGHLVFWDSWPVYKYCPNCGARVVE